MAKTLAFIHRNDARFSVGDFYPVLSVFSHHELGTTTSPFLLLDHLGPSILEPKSKRKGVNRHPHRGFDTVTLMFDGELLHEDSTGSGGTISNGEVQWMTAGAGILHKEEFSPQFREQGGRFEMIQLWVNLPSHAKLVRPRYQSIGNQEIPSKQLEHANIRVIAGEYDGLIGPAQTFSPIDVFDIELQAGQSLTVPAKHGDTSMVYLRSGQLDFDDEILEEQGMAVMSSLGEDLVLQAKKHSHILVLNGAPLNEPLVAHGPFVMNTQQQILDSYEAFKVEDFGKVR